jgi:TatD DNase family protein
MIDSHCHLADEAFESDLDAAVTRAQEAGVSAALCIIAAGDERETNRALDVRSRWDAVRFSTGVHPHNAKAFDGRPEEAARATRDGVARLEARAIGEIGLDYHYDFSPPEIQRDVFAAQIALALELDLPIVIHTREATDDTFSLLEHSSRGIPRGVFHCFTGDRDMARRALDLGFHLSFAGIVSFPKAEALRDAARLVPADRLLIETDSPYLAPVPYRGRRNEPAYVARVLDTLAEVRGESREALEESTTRNFVRLFGEI